METILLIVTILSIATAVVALAAAGRVRRGERQRSDARVAALAAAADAHEASAGVWKPAEGEWQWAPAPSEIGAQGSGTGSERRFAKVSGPRSPIPDLRSPIPAGAPEIAFGTVQRGEATTGRLPLLAAAVLIVLLGGALVIFTMSATKTAASAAQAAPQAAALELVSLGHTRDAGSLTISGAIRNPASGHEIEGLTAVVSLLDDKGGLISTQDVPLDYRALHPGDEAPFKLRVPNPGAIARYRVSFRSGTDLIPHVDRRAETKLAVALR
jgi:type II secretory pathway pseudopilin PulG